MNEQQIALVKKTWKIISKIDPLLVGDVFYSKLFLETPELKPLFSNISRQEQSKKLIAMLTSIISGLDRLDEFKNDIRQLAIRHKKYGVMNWHYAKVGNALLWMLENGLGCDYDDDTKQAWVQCYTELSAAMMSAVD